MQSKAPGDKTQVLFAQPQVQSGLGGCGRHTQAARSIFLKKKTVAEALGIRRALKQDSTVVSEEEKYDADYDPGLGASLEVSPQGTAHTIPLCFELSCLAC